MTSRKMEKRRSEEAVDRKEAAIKSPNECSESLSSTPSQSPPSNTTPQAQTIFRRISSFSLPCFKTAANSKASDENYNDPLTQKKYSDEEGLAKARRLEDIHRNLGTPRTEEMERLNLSNRSDARAPTPPTEEERLAQWKENVASVAEIMADAERRVEEYRSTAA